MPGLPGCWISPDSRVPTCQLKNHSCLVTTVHQCSESYCVCLRFEIDPSAMCRNTSRILVEQKSIDPNATIPISVGGTQRGTTANPTPARYFFLAPKGLKTWYMWLILIQFLSLPILHRYVTSVGSQPESERWLWQHWDQSVVSLS